MGNIAIFIPSIKSGGAEKQAVLLAEVLAGEHNVHFISFYGTSNASHSNMEMRPFPYICCMGVFGLKSKN